MAFITIPNKTSGDSLTAAEFQQLLDALKNAGLEIKTAGVQAGGLADNVIINSDGVKLNGEATVYDDIPCYITSRNLVGGNQPSLEVVATDGNVNVTYAVQLDGGDDNLTCPDYSALDTQTLSISAWIKPDSAGNYEIIDRNMSSGFEFYTSGGKLHFSPTGNSIASTDAGVIVGGAVHHVVVTANAEGANTRIKLYVNGTLKTEQVLNETINTGTGGIIIGQWHAGGWNFKGVIDEVFGYNVVLTDAQVVELYNNGEGTTNHPAGIVETTDVIFKFSFEENTGTTSDNGCTLGAGYDITLNSGTSWTSGLIGNTSGSIGVVALSFPPNILTEVWFDVQFPHWWKEGSIIYPHVHTAAESGDAGNFVLGLEYLWVNIGDAWGNTTVIRRTISNSSQVIHHMYNLPLDGIDGTGKTISSILLGRLFRDGTNIEDTYNGKVFISQLDIHGEKDTVGSRTVMSK